VFFILLTYASLRRTVSKHDRFNKYFLCYFCLANLYIMLVLSVQQDTSLFMWVILS